MAFIVTPRQLTLRAQFYDQLGQLTAAGITVPAALELIGRNPPSREFRGPIQRMCDQLAHGASVADAMPFLGDWVPDFDIALIHAGEQSGRLDSVCKLLGGYYTERAALIRQLISDVAYTALVFHVMVFVFPFVYWVAGKLGNVGFFLETFGTLAVVYGVVCFAIYACQGKRGEPWRAMFERICRRVPLLGSARLSLALSRLSAALEALISAGVNIIEAWEFAATASGSPAMAKTVQSWRSQLTDGQTPSELVSESPSQFPEVFANLYHSGEISGQLDETLQRLHKYYDDEARRKFHFLAKASAQLIYLLIAGIVAYKIISYYLGYFHQLNDIMK